MHSAAHSNLKTETADEGPELLCRDASGTVSIAGGFDVVWASSRDPQKEVNEDAACAVDLGERGFVACVADGMGGMAHGAMAARICAESVEAACMGGATSLRAAMVDGIEMAHRRVREEVRGGGATVVAVAIEGDSAQIVHAGDAEALVMGQRGKLKFRTVPHSPVGYAQEAGVLDEESALFHPERHLVSNGVGVDGMQVQIGPRLVLGRRDTILLCTDGLTDNAFENEIVGTLRAGQLLGSATKLFDLCHDRIVAASRGEYEDDQPGKSDDLTLMAIRRRVDA